MSDRPVHLGIVELVDFCASMEQRNHTVFESLGAWLRSSDPPQGELGRTITEACHRHAEHASLWNGRRPTIPIGAPAESTGTEQISDSDAYREILETLQVDASSVAARVDAELDPSTRRVLEVVERDLGSIADRL